MTDPKFTPGPWTFKAAETYAIKDANLDTLATANFLHLRGRRKDEEVTANAHLIAAAPDMYEALERLNKMTIHATAADWDAAWDAARAALAKARGEK